MKQVKINFIHNNINCSGIADFFDSKNDEINIIKTYFAWKDLNQVYANYNMRRANVPELLSEGLTALMFNWYRTNSTNFTGLDSSSMDLVYIDSETNNGITIQLKSCSTDSVHNPGPTSFGPESQFDKLIFMHLDCDIDTAYWYELDSSDYKNWKVNRTETIADQQKQGRRPRVTLLPKIKENKLTPIKTYIFDRNKIYN